MKTNTNSQPYSKSPAAYTTKSSGLSMQPQPIQLSTDEDENASPGRFGNLNLGNWASRLSMGGNFRPNFMQPLPAPSLLNQPQRPFNFQNQMPGPANPGFGSLLRPGGDRNSFNLRFGNDENNITGSRNFQNGNTTLGARLANRFSLGLGLNRDNQPNNLSGGYHGDRFNFGGNVNPQNGAFGLNFGLNNIPRLGDLSGSANANPAEGSFGLGARLNNIRGSRFGLGADYNHSNDEQRFMFNLFGRF